LIAQHKLLRVLRLIAALQRTPHKTIRQLAAVLETTPRSVYRYLALLEEVGFLIDKDFEGRYFLFETEGNSTGVLFAPEETGLIRDLLLTASPSHLLTDAILKKLYVHSELMPLPANLLKVKTGQVIRQLLSAMDEKKQVLLKKYHSANSDSIQDRLVEPLELTDNYLMLWAYEPETSQVKLFKTERIAGIELLNSAHTYTSATPITRPDPFGMVGEGEMKVVLHMNGRAAMLLKEEYPLCAPLVVPDKQKGGYLFTRVVQYWKGVGRFIMGLPGEVEVVEPEELREYLRERVKQMSF
jgi:predicted DNA-binding transcriptional regulator YafY